ncbi:MAG: flagellar filament capping protein FliD [Algiphilus sp.]
MDPIRFAGIGSGLDLESMTRQLLQAERAAPELRLNREEKQIKDEASAFNSLSSAVSSLTAQATALSEQIGQPSRSVEVDDDAPFSVTASKTASTGRFEVETEALATAQKLRSGAFDPAADIGTGTLTFSLGGESFDIEVLSGNGTPDDIAAAVNNAENNPGIRATVINGASGDQIVFSSEATGAANTITVTASGGDGGLDALSYAGDGINDNLTQIAAASDARIRVDGVEITSATNQFSNVIDGIDIDVSRADPGTNFNVDVRRDDNASADAIQRLVDAYNDTRRVIDQQTRYNAETGNAGALLGDSAVRSLSGAMRSALNIVESGEISVLSQVGIQTDADGRLSFDRAAFTDAMNTNADGVAALLGQAGLSGRIDTAVSGYTGDDGLLEARGDSLDKRLERIEEDRLALDRRMEQYEQRLRSQFTALDSIVAQLQQDGQFLLQQLGLPRQQ